MPQSTYFPFFNGISQTTIKKFRTNRSNFKTISCAKIRSPNYEKRRHMAVGGQSTRALQTHVDATLSC